ncbi:MAG: hypothetical protein IPM82_32290 [Saprospiraceae bacterium]|nr:hypothetical protein [Saprospiraceae bacterium]
MKTFSFKPLVAIFATVIALASCQKDSETAPDSHGGQPQTNVQNDDSNAVTDRANCEQSITIPANSVDALAAAIANICTGGTIWLAPGLHTENAGVVIGKRVNIKGQEGAVLKIQATSLVDFSVAIDVALHFKYATNSKLENIDIQPTTAIGGTAILLENSGGTTVNKCHFNDFQWSILVEKSGGVKITNNVVVVSTAWQTGAIPQADGIIIINGHGALIKGNEVSGGLFGIWPCDQEGKLQDNFTHHNYIGVILCKVPANSYVLPSGESVGATFPCTHWTVTNNNSEDNFTAGYIVIDGANHNKLINNNASGNGTYDIELVGDSYRFGFLTPFSHDNVVHAGSFQNITIKDCGQNNTVYGGVEVDTSVDPCN